MNSLRTGNPDSNQQLRLTGWRALRKNTLRGFVSIVLPCGLEIRDIPVHCSYGAKYALLPAKPQLDEAGNVRTLYGKAQYTPVVKWENIELQRKFSDAVVEAVLAFDPNALGE